LNEARFGAAGPAREIDHPSEHPIAQHPFCIIGQHDDVAFRKRSCEPPSDLGGTLVVDRVRRLVVHPQQLVGAPGGEPRLYGRRSMRARKQPRVYAIAGFGDEALNLCTRIIGADHADEDCSRAQRRNIVGNIGGTAQARPGGGDPQHRDRGLRRDPADLAGHVSVEHDVAEHEHRAANEEWDKIGDRAVRDLAAARRAYRPLHHRHRAPHAPTGLDRNLR